MPITITQSKFQLFLTRVMVCPVSWKMSKKFVSCCQSPEFTVLYRHVFYYFKSLAERDIFLRNPRNFTEKVIFSSERNTPKRIRCYKAAELVA